MDNIISDQNEWIAIDPKGIVGPKEFEIACFDFITKDELSSAGNIPELFDARAIKLSRLLKIDHSILKNWVFIRLVLGACWMIEDNGKADVFLNQVQAIFPD
jgi:streptomycin 6-kinase